MRGGRLCTARELEGECAAGVGCGFDSNHVWTSDGPASDVDDLPAMGAESLPAGGFYASADGGRRDDAPSLPAAETIPGGYDYAADTLIHVLSPYRTNTPNPFGPVDFEQYCSLVSVQRARDAYNEQPSGGSGGGRAPTNGSRWSAPSSGSTWPRDWATSCRSTATTSWSCRRACRSCTPPRAPGGPVRAGHDRRGGERRREGRVPPDAHERRHKRRTELLHGRRRRPPEEERERPVDQPEGRRAEVPHNPGGGRGHLPRQARGGTPERRRGRGPDPTEPLRLPPGVRLLRLPLVVPRGGRLRRPLPGSAVVGDPREPHRAHNGGELRRREVGRAATRDVPLREQHGLDAELGVEGRRAARPGRVAATVVLEGLLGGGPGAPPLVSDT
ncbi:hypothetical protein THAOC_26527 [Thalassiosira oceanica]|uniref:Uncharacterized protein n=1 Tax=Thalassiosira oceanica TaxID=159749 RepID=K0RNT1_THAOC|nr:hypothetical protein THAOC_26527 [Thalassiosira oceanica]|eukprot:EJK53939.1 hypothetical protein THAOC_26527 [Thalassiosira oceanica]